MPGPFGDAAAPGGSPGRAHPLNADSPLGYYRAIETRDSSIEPAGAPMERGVAIGIGVGVAVSIAALIFMLLFLLGTGIT